MQEYTLGFAFSNDFSRLVTIEKNRPTWQAGKLNGVGGHVEAGERPVDAMVREFYEEAGVHTVPDEWHLFAIMRGVDWPKDPTGSKSAVVHCYELAADPVYNAARATTDEALYKGPLANVLALPHIPNLPILLPLAIHRDVFQRPISLEWAETYPR